MITEYLITFGFWLASQLTAIIPTIQLPVDELTEATNTIVSMIEGAGSFIDLTAIKTFLSVIIVWYMFRFMFGLTLFVVRILLLRP
jgi:hypothetical protein